MIPAPGSAPASPAERRADDFLAPVLFTLIAAVREAAARISTPSDAEAIHDLRVALRRLRTVLRPARALHGKRRMREIGAELRRFAQATGALRDEEVLREILTALDLPPRARRDLDAWLVQRARQERARRRRAIALLTTRPPPPASGPEPPDAAARRAPHAPSLGEALAHLERRLGRRRPDDTPPSALSLAEHALASASAGVGELLGGHVHDAAAMHALRIRYKRLRYTAELFAPLLGDAAAPIAPAAARMQKHLGELHDLDQALLRVARARGLPEATRTTVRRALTRASKRRRERVHRDIVSERARRGPRDCAPPPPP